MIMRLTKYTQIEKDLLTRLTISQICEKTGIPATRLVTPTGIDVKGNFRDLSTLHRLIMNNMDPSLIEFEIERMKETLKLKGVRVQQGWGDGSQLKMIYETMPNQFRLSFNEIHALEAKSRSQKEFGSMLEHARLECVMRGWC